ncbi:alpha-2-macroglobulin-like isoform X2 [Dendrobates tinctorius]|uniref:alpha-2-macroglobulin-like isoform X2 n=1 Tax=Dendrobates tinctorius TaxID=92724 RepID=UPI003CC972DA
MGHCVFCLWMVVLQIFAVFEAKLHYAVLFPSELYSQHLENICLQLENAEGESSVKISLNLRNKDTTLFEKKIQQHTTFICSSLQVPIAEEDVSVGTLTTSIESSGELVNKSTKVLVKKQLSKTLVQTDKPLYKPGQTVNFRILSINEDFQPENILIPVIEVQDPEKNRIGQWLNVNLNQGIAEFSLVLSSEPTLGEYSIKLKGKSYTFTVEEYVLPKFEVDIQFPNYVMFNSKQFPVQVCGKYTYGKPVQGNFNVSICREAFIYRYWRVQPKEQALCANFRGKLDKSGCHTIVVNSELFKINETGLKKELKGAASVTEEGTGVELSSTSQTIISNVINKISFINADTNYKAGIPYNGLIKVEDAGGVPKPNTKVYLKHRYDSEGQTLVTEENGRARTDLKKNIYVYGRYQPDFGEASIRVIPFYSRSKSYLRLNSLDHVLPCEGRQDVQVEYIISRTELNNVKKLSLHYLLVSKVKIKDSGTVEIETDNTNEDLYGRVTLNLPLSAGTATIVHVLVYIFLPNGEMLADTAKFNFLKCFKNKVSTEFSPDEVLPGSDVSLQVQADPGSLCGLRVVDESVVLMKPEKELTAEKVFDLFPSVDFKRYDYRIQEHEERCSYRPIRKSSHFVVQSIRRPRFHEDDSVDIDSLLEAIRLKIVTSADTKKPLTCSEPEIVERESKIRIISGESTRSGRRYKTETASKVMTSENDPSPELSQQPRETEKVRAYFPETWIWELVALGESGKIEIHHKVPDTITDWNTGAICMGPNGFGLSPSSSLRVFQPFFVDLTLPYSVVRGETFTLKASVFNYLKQCIKVRTTLQTTDELEETDCADCEYDSCICADESKTFYWNLKASKLGDVNITVKTEALDSKEFCGNEIPVVPKQGRTDTIIKTVLVQPGGVLEEKSYSSLICIKEEDQSKVEDIYLRIPDNILEDSARAHITVLGDLMGTAMQNLDRLLAMPYGCGEQNMVLFAPNIFIKQYLEKTHQLNNEIQSKAKKFLESGYQRQLTYKRDDGSYSAFGKNDKEGNTWLTGFVVKSFSKARPYIFIDESHLNHSFSWLKKNQEDTGCFRSVGRLFNNAMKGGVEDHISLSAYITITVLEAGLATQDPLLSNALSCLMKASMNVSNVYTQALLAYAFTLSGEIELRKTIMDKLDEKAIRGDGQLHWKRNSAPPPEDSFWRRAPSAEVELTSYVLLALLSGPTPDLGRSSEIVSWLSKQQNPYGGYSSTQDTVVALQALAKYSEITFSNKGDVTVAVSSKSGFLEQFQVDKNNRLLLQRASLSKVPEDYTATITGSGCVFVQAVLRYNVPPPKGPATFSLNVKSSSTRECVGDPLTKFQILITAAYTGTREKSNMAVIEVKMLSGYIPVKHTIKNLEKSKLIQRSEIQMDLVTLYLDQIDHNPISLSFMVEQSIVVKDLKAATAKVYDYYETDEHATVDYNLPCSYDISGNSR